MKLYFLLRAGLSTTKNHSSHDFVLLKCGSLQEWRLTAMLVQDGNIGILYAGCHTGSTASGMAVTLSAVHVRVKGLLIGKLNSCVCGSSHHSS